MFLKDLKIWLVLSLLLSLSVDALGNDRYLFASGFKDGSDCYLDKESLQTLLGGNIRVWTKTIVSNQRKKNLIAQEKDKTLKKKIVKLLEIKDCVEVNILRREYRVVQTILMGSDGNVIKEYDTRYADWEYIPPDSVAEGILKTVQVLVQDFGQQQEYQQLQSYNNWLASQPDFPEFKAWFDMQLIQRGLTGEQINARFQEHIKNGGRYSDIRGAIAKWYNDFHIWKSRKK